MSLENCADHSLLKSSGPKIELFYFMANGWIERALAGLKNQNIGEAWWGRSDWHQLRRMNSWARADLMAARFREELGYATATPWAIYERSNGGRIMYFMIHATDHPDAPHLMSRAYRLAVRDEEPMEQFEMEFAAWRNHNTPPPSLEAP